MIRYVLYGVSYHDLEEIMGARSVFLDHTTLNRWVPQYSSAIAEVVRKREGTCDHSWMMDETYIKVKDAWVYLHRAVDKHEKSLICTLSERRNKPATAKY